MTRQCLVCAAAGAPWFVKQERSLLRCPRCALVWVLEGLATASDGRSIYEGDNPVFLEGGNQQYYLDETNFASCREKLAWVRRYASVGSGLLDAGANYGHFLATAGKDFRAVGLELSETAVAWSRRELGVENHVASLYDVPPALAGPHDLVTAWDVIEHVPDPRGAISALARLVKPGGYLFLSTPDTGSLVARAMRKKWHYLDPVQHIVLFNRTNLRAILREVGLQTVAMRSFGHHYRVGYVLDRLSYLHADGALGRLFPVAARLARPLAAQTLYINLGDVMGVVARRPAGGALSETDRAG